MWVVARRAMLFASNPRAVMRAGCGHPAHHPAGTTAWTSTPDAWSRKVSLTGQPCCAQPSSMRSHSTGRLLGCSTTSSVARSAVPSAAIKRVETGTGRPVSSEAVNTARWIEFGTLRPDSGQGERHVGASAARDLLDADGGWHPLLRRPPAAGGQKRRGGGRDHRQRDEDRAHVPGRSHQAAAWDGSACPTVTSNAQASTINQSRRRMCA